MELYEAFISSVPAHLRVTMAVRGRYQAYVETEGGAGLASLPLPGKKPYGDAAVCTDWLGKPLRDLAAQLGSDDMALSALGCAAVNAWFNRRESMEALGVTLYPPEIDEGDVFRTLEPECAGKLVSTIGHFRGGEKLAGMRELRVFEKDPRPGDYPEWEEDRLLPGSDVVVITGMALTKLDGTAKGGIVIAVADALQIPVKFVGVGEQADDLMPFSAKEFVEALI